MLKTTVSHSLELDSKDAIEDVLEQCKEQLGDLTPRAGLLSAGSNHNHSFFLSSIKEVYPEIELIGGTSLGELSFVHGVTNDSIVLTLFCSDDLHFKAGLAEKISEDPFNHLKNAVELTKSGFNHNIDLCITTPSAMPLIDGSYRLINSDDTLQGMKQGLGDKIPVVGGCSVGPLDQGDFQFYNFQVYKDSAPFLLISGPLLFSIGVENGFVPIGNKTKVTHAEKNIVYKIGDKSPLDFYEHYLGKSDIIGISEYALAVYENDEDHFVLRSGMYLDESRGSISFSGNVPEGATVQLTHAIRDNLIESVHKSVNSAITNYPGLKPSVALCFSCGGRNWILGTRTKEEYEVLKTYLPDLPVAGFYAAGEIGLTGIEKNCLIHTASFVCVLIGTE